MKNITVKLKIDPEKYKAACQFMGDKGLEIDDELAAAVDKLYQKYVPAAVRKYIEGTVTSTSIRHRGASEGSTMQGNSPPTFSTNLTIRSTPDSEEDKNT